MHFYYTWDFAKNFIFQLLIFGKERAAGVERMVRLLLQNEFLVMKWVQGFPTLAVPLKYLWRYREEISGCQGGGWSGRDGVGDWGKQMQTITYRMDKQQSSTLYHRELYLISCDKPSSGKEYIDIDIWRKAWQPTPVFLSGESPRTEGPGKLQSMGSQRVGHDWRDLAHTEINTL